MEESPQYFIQGQTSLYPSNKREQVLHSKYFQVVAQTVNALIIGAVSSEFQFADDDELISRAFSITDQLIEKAGEKL